MPTVEELNALPFTGGDPFSGGLVSRDYRSQYEQHGYPLRWWKGFQAPNGATGPNGEARNDQGRIYVEQTHGNDGTPMEDCRCMLYRTRRDIYVPDFGLFEKGSTSVSVLPEQVEFARLDRVAFPEVTWIARDFITRGNTNTDTLTQPPVKSIDKVLFYPANGNAIVIDPDAYEAMDNGIKWLHNEIPYNGVYSVEYHYLPIFEWLMVEDLGVVQRGSDRSKLPQRGLITQRHEVNDGV